MASPALIAVRSVSPSHALFAFGIVLGIAACSIDNRTLVEGDGSKGGSATNGGKAGRGGGGQGGRGGTGGRSSGAAGSSDPCPDLDMNLVPDCDETLVLNADFQSDDAEWAGEDGSTLAWNPVDAQTLDTSGSLMVFNEVVEDNENFTSKSASQCVGITGSLNYLLSSEVHIQADEVSGFAQLGVWFYDGEDCSGKVTLAVTPQSGTIQRWVRLSGTWPAPGTARSAWIRLSVLKKASQEERFSVRFDNVLFRPIVPN